jgi:hypothetical protein
MPFPRFPFPRFPFHRRAHPARPVAQVLPPPVNRPKLAPRIPPATAPRAPVVTLPVPRPAPQTPLAMPASPLVDFVAAAYESTTPTNMRWLLPRLMAACFPWPGDEVGLIDLKVYRALAFMLDELSTRHSNATLRAHLQTSIEPLLGGASFAASLAARSRPAPATLVEDHILSPLRADNPALVTGGYVCPDESHAVTVYFVPLGADIRVLAFNRAKEWEPWHIGDARGRPMPLCLDVPRDQIERPAALAALHRLMRLQEPDPNHDSPAFYGTLKALLQATGGRLRLGKLGSLRGEDFHLPAQTQQTAATCTLHTTWAWLRYVLFVCCNGDFAQAESEYKKAKAGCRQILLEQAIEARRVARGADDKLLVAQLTDAIEDARAWLLQRLAVHPAHRALLARIDALEARERDA